MPPQPLSDDQIRDIRQRLERAVRHSCPARLAERAEDLVQDCLIRILEILKKGEGVEQLASSYLWKTAHSVLVDEIRRHDRRPTVPLPEEDEPGTGYQLESNQPGPDQLWLSRRLGEGLRTCLNPLVEDRRRAVTLYLMGYKVPALAQELAADVKRAENLVFRGLKQVRECLREKGLTP